MVFQDRVQAGQLLAKKLKKFSGQEAIVLGLPRGGVPVAAEVARTLGLPLDVLIVRKLGAPFNSELAVGAICEDDQPTFNSKILSRIGLEPDDMIRVVQSEGEEIQRQTRVFRQGRRLASLEQKIVILVDDGLATGSTVQAAISYLRKKKVSQIVVAVPVAAASSADFLRRQVEEVIAVEESEHLRSVGEWYQDFSQVSDQEVISCLPVRESTPAESREKPLQIRVDKVILEGDLILVPKMKSLILFVHGSGSSRKSPRNRQVAQELNRAGFGTLLFDLLTDEEAKERKNVFNIEFLSQRLKQVTEWIREQENLDQMPLAYFGASTGAAAALQAVATSSEDKKIYAVVSRGGRPDLAGKALPFVKIPTLLLVGELDQSVIELNEYAQKQLPNAKLKMIPGASHLFEEPGTLEEVSRQALEWFENSLPPSPSPSSRSSFSPSALEDITERNLIDFKREQDLDRLIQSLKDSRVVMLGEATHGTRDFYHIRSLISQRLIKDHGFKFIAVEGDWPDAYRLHQYLQTGQGQSARQVLMKNHRWPTWMWANQEVVDLAEALRGRGIGFYGLDVYSLFESMEEVITYLKRNDPSLAEEVRRRYACFDPFEGDEISYARSLLKFPRGCLNEVVETLQKLIHLRIEEVQQDGEGLFSAQQNARIVANAESYYRSMLAGDANSWNVRDSHMMETLDRLLERAGEGAKAIVWAHNTHIGDYRATDMKDAGYVNLGGLARQSYGEENVSLVGFGTYQGEVLAGRAWGAPEQVMPLPPAQPGSYEHHFHNVAKQIQANQFYLLFDDSHRQDFSQRMGHRAVGVVYDPQTEARGNYVPTELARRYDAFIFVDRTQALQPLPTVVARGEFPETWPSGQ